MTRSPQFFDFCRTLQHHGRTIWLGQSVDTSRIHTSYDTYATVPILTSVGCAMRRPTANEPKFDKNLREFLGAKSRLMVDSGGFVLMTKKDRHWTVDRVSELYKRIDADHLVSLDIPPNRLDKVAERRRKYATTLENLAVLQGRFGERIVPVVHGRGIAEIAENCDKIIRLAPHPRMIGIGGLVPILQSCGNILKPTPSTPQQQIADAIRCVRAYFPGSRIHIFGVGSLHTVLGVIAAGADSVDSIGWRQAAGFGSVYIPGRHRRLLTDRDREAPCRPYASRDDLSLLSRCVCPACRGAKQGDNIAILSAHFKPRAAHNIWVLHSEVAGYLGTRGKAAKTDYLRARLSPAWMAALEKPTSYA
jgi:queuine/archaeosine tRNA-ribosyltransferase